MRKKAAWTCLILLLCISLAAAYLYFEESQYKDRIFDGIYIEKINVGGLSKKEAELMVSKYIQENIFTPILLVHDSKKWQVDPSDILEIDVKKSIENAFMLGKSKFFVQSFLHRLKYRRTPIKINLIVTFNEDRARIAFKEIKESVTVQPKNAFFKIENDTVTVVKDEPGLTVDEEKLKEEIVKVLWEPQKQKIVHIPVKELRAEKTRDDLLSMNIKVKMAEYSTKFNKAQRERAENIRLAAEKLNGHIIAPNEIFSFNDTVGERTGEKGYKEAPIFFKNETVPGVGGGVCQLSSTIYNLALLTDLEIVERANHSLPVNYVPLGRDATVNYNHIDLKFRNTTGSYLLIFTEVQDGTLTVKFFGDKKFEKNIKVYSETVKTIPPPITIKKASNMEKGKMAIKQGTPGYQVRVWKVYDAGGKQEKKLVSVDTYYPTPTILYLGEKSPEAKKVNEPLPAGDGTTTPD